MRGTLCACASGGSGGGPAPVVPVAEPAPTPPPVLTSAGDFETTEYGQNWAFDRIGAAEAYSRGATGEGVTVAVIDTGIDVDHPELAHAIHPSSTDIVSGRNDLSGESTHGTLVAGVIAAARDGEGLHGLAFDADLLAIRTDISPDDFPDDNCVGSGDTCGFYDSQVADAVRYAVANGADIINLSFGGADPSSTIGDALAEAAAAGVLIVMAAGNDGDATPIWPANFAADARANGHAVVAGAFGQDGTISDFSNRAGGVAQHFLLAPGDDILTTRAEDANDPDDDLYARNFGTSLSTPHVSAALALLLDAFPELDPVDALNILYDTAVDLGPEGPDETYGWGAIDLAAAFGPTGSTTLSLGGGSYSTTTAFAPSSGAFGDFAAGLFDNLVIRDSYDRGFTVDDPIAPPKSSSVTAFESAALSNRLEARAARTAFGHASFRPGEDEYIALTNLEQDDPGALKLAVDTGRMRLLAGSGFAAPAPGGRAPGAVLSAAAWSGGVAPLVASGRWSAAEFDFGRWSFGARASSHEENSLQAAHIARHFGRHALSFETGQAKEDGRAFGSAVISRFGGADSGRSSFTALAWDGPLRGAWRGAARMEGARANLADPGHITLSEDPTATAWSLGAERAFKHAALGLTLSQPLRVESGTVTFNAPVGLDDKGRTVFERRTGSLAPSGREIGLETALRAGLAEGVIGSAAVKLSTDPGHVGGATPEAMTWFGVRVTR